MSVSGVRVGRGFIGLGELETESGAYRLELAQWRLMGIGLLRIAFGVVWAFDAWFKWQPQFVTNFAGYLTGAQQGQPAWVQSWIGFWVTLVRVNPGIFARLVALGETAIAVTLILGILTNLSTIGGAVLALMIWSTAEGFGGPYQAGSTDVGSAVIYALVLAGLFLSQAGLYLGLDRRLTPALGRLGFLASGRLPPHWIRQNDRSTSAPHPTRQEERASREARQHREMAFHGPGSE